tara:strand:+ start:17255 stop:19759 length:2505 start_codon:yes stop_codon:yes gene_type:complete
MSTNQNKAIAVRLSLNSTQFLSGLNTSKGALTKFASSVKTVATGIVTSLGLIGGYVGKEMVDQFVSFEFQMAKVKATTGAVGKEFKTLVDSALNLGRTTQFTAQEVADLQFRLSKLGFKTDDINSMTGDILNLALALGEDLGEAATLTAQTLRIFGKDSGATNDMVNEMAMAFTNSGLALDTYGESLKYIGPVAASAGSSLTDMSAYLGVLANKSIEASIAGTSMRKMFVRAAVAGRTVDDMLREIRFSSNQSATAFELFGQTAMTSGIILANSTDEISVMNQTIADSKGQVKAMAAIMDSTAQGSLKRLTSAFNGLSIEVGDQIMNAIRPLITQLTSFASTIDSRIITAILAFIAILVGSSGLILAVMLVYKVLTTAGKGLLLFGKGIKFAVSAVALGAKSMIISMGPIGWIVAAIVAAIVAIGIALANNNETVKKYVLESINSFIKWYNELIALRVVVESIIFLFKFLWETIKLNALNTITIFKSLGEAFFLAMSGKFSEASDVLSNGWDTMVGDAKSAIDTITEAYDKGIENIKNGEKKPWTMGDLDGAIKNVKDKFHDVTKNIKNSIKGVFDDILGNFKSGSSILNGDGLSTPERDVKVSTNTDKDFVKKPDPNAKTDWQKGLGEWVTKWGTAVQAVQDIFGSMFEFISNGYEAQLKQVEALADKEVALVGNQAISEQEKSAKVKKIREKQAKDEAKLKLKMWKADKAASISSIIISGAMAIAQAFAKGGPLGFVTGPLVAAAVGAQLAVAASTKPPKFADGGIVSGRTLAEVGEYSGVESNPEVIAPLDKLKKLMGSGGSSVYVYGEFRQKGSDLVAVIDEETTRQNRY